MKNRFLQIIAIIAISISAVSCDNGSKGSSDNNEKLVVDLGDGSSEYQLSSDITLYANTTYNLRGFVYVPYGVTLTIEPGTVIKGDRDSKGSLIVERGAKIIANGTAEKPIVFTSSQPAGSRRPGDWGGIIILGYAENNGGERGIEGGVRSLYGGFKDSDCSGEISYLRIEFAGIEYKSDDEINGLTLGSVGSATVMHHIQVSYSGDDSFEWFGGTVNASHLVSYGAWDDDFDTDAGYRGNVQFGVALRDPQYGDISASNSFESDNSGIAAMSTPKTAAIFSNISLFGPVADPSNYEDRGSDKGSATGFFQTGVQIRRGSYTGLYNSLIAGYPIGLVIENDKDGDALTAKVDELEAANGVSGVVIAGMQKNYQDWATNIEDIFTSNGSEISCNEVQNYFEREELKNRVFDSVDDLKLSGNPFNLTSPNMFFASNSPLASGAVKVGNNIKNVDYIGAFSPSETTNSNWMSGWTNFDPQNTEY